MSSKTDEILRRIRETRRRMTAAGLDAVLVQDRANTLYLSGFTGSASTILVTRRAAVFLTDARYIDRARRQQTAFTVLEHGESKRASLAGQVKARNLKTIGFEGSLPYTTVQTLRRQARPARLKLARCVEEARVVKSDIEIRLMRKAQSEAEKIWETVIAEAKPGVTERQIRNRIIQLIDKGGLDGVSFPPIVAFGPNSANPHHEFTDRKLKKRDVLLIDMGVKVRGYCSDMTRTVFIGAPTKQMREVYETVLEAQERAIEAIAVGVTGGKVHAIARKVIADAGYGDKFRHGLGHGVGVEIHEAPGLGGKGKAKLESGQIVTIEPGIYLTNRFGVRIEDIGAVTPKGLSNFTKARKELIVL